ncbi:hypothetical protein F0U61_02580 [Archangium violaceum]|uniref:hypothetical protein n=1 Tax=Archangium violaceum TaxID=83451 RepID=UPI002B2B1E31|nr:hypothetical protein F0U61_02580 [Archangium violaceum]
MRRFAHHTKTQLADTAAQLKPRRRFASFAAPPLFALAIVGGALLPSGQAQAAGQPDLDVVTCRPVDDPVDYGDGIDWYKLEVTYHNKGTAPSPGFQYLVRPSWGVDLFSGQLKNEAYVVRSAGPLQAGQSVSTFFWVTKDVVDRRTYGIFLDNNGFNQGTVAESNELNNFCTFYANPS